MRTSVRYRSGLTTQTPLEAILPVELEGGITVVPFAVPGLLVLALAGEQGAGLRGLGGVGGEDQSHPAGLFAEGVAGLGVEVEGAERVAGDGDRNLDARHADAEIDWQLA